MLAETTKNHDIQSGDVRFDSFVFGLSVRFARFNIANAMDALKTTIKIHDMPTYPGNSGTINLTKSLRTFSSTGNILLKA